MTDAQKKSRARFKAAVSEAAKLRKKNPRLSQAEAVKQAWAILYGKQRAGKKIAGPKKVAKKTATKKASKSGERHTDTKSHNVNIRVMSGVKSDIKKRLKQSGKRLKHGYDIIPGKIRKISGMTYAEKIKNFTRVNNDVNGNPRYVIHFTHLINDEERNFIPWNGQYEYALKKAKLIGGKKFHNKQYGGGIVFQSYNLENTFDKIKKLQESTPKIKL